MTPTLTKTTLTAAALAFLLTSAASAAVPPYKNLTIAVYFRYQETQSIPNNLAQFATPVGRHRKPGQGRQGLPRNHPQQRTGHRRRRDDHEKVLHRPRHQGLRRPRPDREGRQRLPVLLLHTPADRDKVKAMAEFTAKYFDEIILDDFYFTNSKTDPTSPPRATNPGPSSAPN